MALQFSSLTIPPARAINAAAGQRTLTTAADGGLVPVTFGQDRIPAQVLNILVGADPRKTLIQAVWGHACHSVTSIKLNGLDLPAGAAVTSYTGSQTTADATLVAAFAAQSITYTDTLAGYAYSVIELPTVLFTGQLELSAWVHGRRLYDPRKDSTAGGSGTHRLATPSTWEWSDNPALALADWTASNLYGAGDPVDWASVPAAANANDATIGSPAERRRIIGLTLSQAADVGNIAEALRAYAGCWLVPSVAGVRLVPDADSAPVATYSHAAGNIADISPLQLPDRAAAPTVVQVVYTDQSGTERRDASAEAQLPGVGSTLPVRRSVVRLPGIGRYSQAKREAIERLNKLTHEGVATTLEVFDIGIRHDKGDIISVTHPIGLAAASMRVVDVDMPAPGRWRLALMRHDPLAYSDEVEAATTGAATDRIINTGPASDVTGAAAAVSAGLIRVTWGPCPDIGYDSTEVRTTNADWGSYTVAPLYRGKASEFPYLVDAVGTYVFHLRHISSGNPSAATVTVSVVVGTGDLGGGAAAQPALVLTPALATIQADADGIVPSWAGTQTVATVVLPDGSDDTAGWTFSKADQGVVSTIAGNVITVTGWDTASGAVDPYWAQTLFLARFNGALTEERRGRRLGYLLQDDTTPDWVTDGGDTWLQLGNSTGATAGTNWGVVQVEPSTDLLAETGDMVIEGRWRMESIPARPRTLIALLDAAGVEIYRIGWDVGGQHQMTVRTAAGSTASQYGGPSVTAGTEYHVAMVRVGNVHTIFVNGVAAGTTITTSYRHPAGARWVVMAASSTGAGAYNDYGFVRLGWARITAGTHRNYTGTFTPAINPPLGYLTQAAVEVTATKSGQELVRRFEVITQRAAYGGEEAATGTLSRDLIALPADWAGNVASYTGATTALAIRRGAVDITHLYTLSRANGANVGSSLSGATLSITSLTADASTVTITATRAGYPTITATVQVTRSRTPQPVVNVSGPASVVVAGDTAGTVPSASLPVAVAVTASDAGTDVTGSYTWTVSASAGITLSSTTAASTTITAMASGTDSGSTTWTGTRAGWPTLSWRASVSKTRLLLPSGAIVASLPAISIFDNASAATVGLRLTSDGRVQVYRQNATGAWVTVANFYNPTTAAIGAGYRVRLLGTPAGSTAGTWNAWQALSSDVTWQAGSEVGGGVGSHGWTLHQIQIAATGSTDILATYLVTATAIVEGS